MDTHMNIPAWPGLIAAIGILITRVSAVEVTSGQRMLYHRSCTAGPHLPAYTIADPLTLSFAAVSGSTRRSTIPPQAWLPTMNPSVNDEY